MKPTLFCNACGREIPIEEAMGGKFLGYRVCSVACIREMRWRDTFSILRKDYRPMTEEERARMEKS